MSFLAIALRTLLELWPFLKELVIKNTSLREAIQKNKLVTTLFTTLVFAMAIAYYLGTLVVSESNRVKELTNANAQLQLKVTLVSEAQDNLQRELTSRTEEAQRLIDIESWLRRENTRLHQETVELTVEREEMMSLIEELRTPKPSPVVDDDQQEQIHENATTFKRAQERFEWLRDQENG